MTRRRNFFGFGNRTTAPSKRSKKPPKDPAKRYKSSHWGIEHTAVIEDPDIQGELVAMGPLRELRYVQPDEDGNWREKDIQIIKFPKGNTKNPPPVLAFTSDTAERIYLSQPPATKRANKAALDPNGEWYRLDDISQAAGGRQAKWAYPNVNAQVFGLLTDCVYKTHKKSDGPSEYIHRFGETSGILPMLALDEDGRYWLAGGDYVVSDHGIEN